MRWVVGPMIAALLLLSSGFMDALERTTEASVALAEASGSAPGTTKRARVEVADLPEVAELTRQQAAAFEALAQALAGSARRVEDLTATLDDQAEGIAAQTDAVGSVGGSVGCIKNRLRSLTDSAERVPGAFDAIALALEGIAGAQNKSLRHLRSINRKLTALGVVATASGVEPPAPPPDAPIPGPGPSPEPMAC